MSLVHIWQGFVVSGGVKVDIQREAQRTFAERSLKENCNSHEAGFGCDQSFQALS